MVLSCPSCSAQATVFTDCPTCHSLVLLNMKQQYNSSQHRCMITSLSDTLLLKISSYLHPPEVYRLAQTSKLFHSPSTELSTHRFLSQSPMKPLKYNQTITNLSCRLLQESLMQGFFSVVQIGDHAMHITNARRIIEFQQAESSKGRKVLLSGSSAVQAVTGKRFEEFDLDFYASRASVRGFRKLMREFGYCCESVYPHYNHTLPHYGDWDQSHIYHVETYIPCQSTETVAISTLTSNYYRAWNAHLAAEESDDDVPQELVDMSFLSYRNACLHKIQKECWHRFPRNYPVALTPTNNTTGQDNTATRNKCKSGSIQLIVCRACPTQVIAKFDMDICKSNFDGNLFHIVSLSDTFNFRTKGDDRMIFLNEYFPHFFQGDIGSCFNYSPSKTSGSNTLSPVALNHISDTEVSDEMLLHIIASVVKTAKRVDPRTQLTVLGTDNFRLLYSGSCIDYTPKYFAHLHNKQVTLLQRALKYMRRGIDVPLSPGLLFAVGESYLSSSSDDKDDTYSFDSYHDAEYDEACIDWTK
jgi:hypothetical protein